MKIILHPDYIPQKEAVIQLTKVFFTHGNLVVQGARNCIKTNILDNEKVNIKFFQQPGAIKAIIYSFFRDSKAKRSFEYANYLIQNKIKTPMPIAYIENRNAFGILQTSFYICKHIDYDFTIRELIHDPLFENRTEIINQFTNFTFEMHEAKINFLDHSPGNTLIVKKASNLFDFYLIDLNRMNFKSLNVVQRMDNFKKMWLSKQMVKIVAKRYAQLSNEPESKLLAILLEKTTSFKRKITRKKYLKRKVGRK